MEQIIEFISQLDPNDPVEIVGFPVIVDLTIQVVHLN